MSDFSHIVVLLNGSSSVAIRSFCDTQKSIDGVSTYRKKECAKYDEQDDNKRWDEIAHVVTFFEIHGG